MHDLGSPQACSRTFRKFYTIPEKYSTVSCDPLRMEQNPERLCLFSFSLSHTSATRTLHSFLTSSTPLQLLLKILSPLTHNMAFLFNPFESSLSRFGDFDEDVFWPFGTTQQRIGAGPSGSKALTSRQGQSQQTGVTRPRMDW